MASDKPKHIDKNLSIKQASKGKIFNNGKPIQANTRKKSGGLTCLITLCCVVIIFLGGVVGAGFILYEKYARPILGISLTEAFGLLKGVYSPDRDEIITNPYDEVNDNEAFYNNLKGALCLAPDFKININDILNGVLNQKTQQAYGAKENPTADDKFTTGNEYFDEMLSKAEFDFSALEDYDGKAKYFNITDVQLASVMQEALKNASNITQLKPVEERIGVKLPDVIRVEQVIFAESASKPKLTATVSLDVRELLASIIVKEKDTFSGVPTFLLDLLPKLLPKELLVSLTFFPEYSADAIAIEPIISINTANDEVLKRMLTSIDNYLVSGGGEKIFTPTLSTIATTVNSSLSQVTEIIGKDSIIYQGATNTLKIDTLGAVLMAMNIQNVNSTDFYTMLQHLHSIDYKSKTEEDMLAFLKKVIPNPPTEQDLQNDLDNLEKSYGVDTSGWDSSNIAENFNKDILEKFNIAEMNYRNPSEMKEFSKLSDKSLALIVNDYLADLSTNPDITANENSSTTDIIKKLGITVADITIGSDIITNPTSRINEERLYLDIVVKLSLKSYIQELVGNQIYTNIILSIIPDNLYISCRVVVDKPQQSDMLTLSINFNKDGTDSMISTVNALVVKFAPESADMFDIAKLTEQFENILYPILNGEPDKDGKYLVPIALTFQEKYVNLPSLYELICIADEYIDADNAENIFIETPTAAKVDTVYRSLVGLADYNSAIGEENIMPDGGVNCPLDGIDLFAENGLIKREFEGNLFLQENVLENTSTPLYEQLTNVFSKVNNLDTIENYINFPQLKSSTRLPQEMNLTITAKEFVKLFDSTLSKYTDEIKKALPYNDLRAFDGEFYLDNGKPYAKIKLYAYNLAEAFSDSLAGIFGSLNIKPKQLFPQYLMLTANVEMEPEQTPSSSKFSDLYYWANGEETPAPPSNRKINLELNAAQHTLVSDFINMFVKGDTFEMATLINQLAVSIDSAFNELKQQNIDFTVRANHNEQSKDKYVLESTNIYKLINTVVFKDSTTPMPPNADINLQRLIYQINDTDGAVANAGANNVAENYSKVNALLKQNYYLTVDGENTNPIKYLQNLGENISSAVNVEDIKNPPIDKDATEHSVAFSETELGKIMQEYMDDKSFDIASFIPAGLYDTFKIHSLHVTANKSVTIIVNATYANANITSKAEGTDVSKLTNLLLPKDAYLTMTLNLTGGADTQSMSFNCTQDEPLEYLMSIVNLNKQPQDENFISIEKSLNQAAEQFNKQLDVLPTNGLCYSVQDDYLMLENFYGVLYKYVTNATEDIKKQPTTDTNSRKMKSTIAQLQLNHANVGEKAVASDLNDLNGQLKTNFGIKKPLSMDDNLSDIKELFTIANFDANNFSQKTGIGDNGLGVPNADYGNIAFSDRFDKIRITEKELAGLLDKVKSDMLQIDFIKEFEMHNVHLTEDITGLKPNILITYLVTTNKTIESGANKNLEFVYSLMPDQIYMSIELNMLTKTYNSSVDSIILNYNISNEEDKKTDKDNTTFVFDIINSNQTNGNTISQEEIIGGDGTESNKGVKTTIYDNINNEYLHLHFKDDLLVSDNLYPVVYKMVLPNKELPTDETAKLKESLVLKKALYSLYHYNIEENPDIAEKQFLNINTSLQKHYFADFSSGNLVTDNPIDLVTDFENRFNLKPNDTDNSDISNDVRLTVNNIDLASLIASKLTTVNIDIFERVSVLEVDIKVVGGNNVIAVSIRAEKRLNMSTPPSYFDLIPNDLFLDFNIDMTNDTNNKITVLGVDGNTDGEITKILNSIIDINAESAMTSIKKDVTDALANLSKNAIFNPDDNTITFDSFYVFLANKLNNGIKPSTPIEPQTLKYTLYYLNAIDRTDDRKLTDADMTYGYPTNKKTDHLVNIDNIDINNSYVDIYDSVIQSKDALNANFTNFRFIEENSNANTLGHVFNNFMSTATDDYLTGKSILVTKKFALSAENIGTNLLISKVVPKSIYLSVLFKESLTDSKFIIYDMPIECMDLFNIVTENALSSTLSAELANISSEFTVSVNVMGVDKLFDYAMLMKGEFSADNNRIAENYARFNYASLPN